MLIVAYTCGIVIEIAYNYEVGNDFPSKYCIICMNKSGDSTKLLDRKLIGQLTL